MLMAVFKAPDDDHSHHSDEENDQAPLLSREDRTVGRPSLEDEIDTFADALGDGPAARATGTLLDGIANVRIVRTGSLFSLCLSPAPAASAAPAIPDARWPTRSSAPASSVSPTQSGKQAS